MVIKLKNVFTIKFEPDLLVLTEEEWIVTHCKFKLKKNVVDYSISSCSTSAQWGNMPMEEKFSEIAFEIFYNN